MFVCIADLFWAAAAEASGKCVTVKDIYINSCSKTYNWGSIKGCAHVQVGVHH
jgi:hypothetical protein